MYCPKDIIIYNCSINFATENLFLMWRINLPGYTPVSVAYTDDVNLNTRIDLPVDAYASVLSELTIFEDNKFVQSIILLEVPRNTSEINGTSLECLSAGLVLWSTITVSTTVAGTFLQT